MKRLKFERRFSNLTDDIQQKCCFEVILIYVLIFCTFMIDLSESFHPFCEERNLVEILMLRYQRPFQ